MSNGHIKNKLGIGTVQFGQDYGISNNQGRVRPDQVYKILDYALNNQIDTIDTAFIYGSEELLGSYPQLSKFKVITKLPPVLTVNSNIDIIEEVNQHFSLSLKRLQLDKVYALLVHSASDLLSNTGPDIIQFLKEIKKEKRAIKIGFSAYSEKEIKSILEFFTPDIIQLPMSIFDQRPLKSGLLKKLKEKSIEVHIRSIFLQGLLFIPPNNLNVFFDPIKSHLERFHKDLSTYNISPINAALTFINSIPEVDKIIVGTTNLKELIEVHKELQTPLNESIDYSNFSFNNGYFANPANWPKEIK